MIIRQENVKCLLPVALTSEELLESAKSLAKITNDLRDTEARKAEVMSQFSADLKKLKATADSLSVRISNGYEHRDVECTWVFDDKMKHLHRNDTGELVKSCAITTDDLQKKLL